MTKAERETSVPAALANANAAATAIGGRLSVEYLHRGRYPVVRARFVLNKAVVSEGVGKGEGRQAEASAVFEALEHYFLSSSRQGLTNQVRPITEIASQPSTQVDGLIGYVAEAHPEAMLGCALYTDLSDDRCQAWVPLFVVDPTYDADPLEGDDLRYREYCRYGTSTGFAAGSTWAEAVLHGLLESLERDALGRFFLARFERRGDREVRVLDERYLTTHLRRLLAEISARSEGTARVIDLTTDVGVPVYMAECRSARYPFGAFGCGCSLDPVYAAERAITELLQNEVEGRWSLVDSYFLAAVEQSESHARIPPDPKRDAHVIVPLRPEFESRPQTPSESLSVAIAVARQSGLAPLFRTVASELPIIVASVYLAGAERFYLCRWGHRLRPTGLPRLQTAHAADLV